MFQAQRDARDARAADPRYSCRFRALPTKTTKLPPAAHRARAVRQRDRRRRITTGPPAGEEIYTDAGGHVKAQFYWDRLGKKDDKSSCWMRTSQLPTGGSVLIPRMKWEVVVRFNEGDADRPYVMSRMYNTVSPPPYPLPANKARSSLQTATTPGGGSTNEFRFNDTKGSEEMMFNASHDMSVDVNNRHDRAPSVGNNLTTVPGRVEPFETQASRTARYSSSVRRQPVHDQSGRQPGTEHVQTGHGRPGGPATTPSTSAAATENDDRRGSQARR